MNAKKEFLDHIRSAVVLCAEVILYNVTHELYINHTPEEFNTFLESIDKEYKNSFGQQELEGIIWYTNGLWSDRSEYDGSEWWERHKCPDPSHLFREPIKTESLIETMTHSHTKRMDKDDEARGNQWN